MYRYKHQTLTVGEKKNTALRMRNSVNLRNELTSDKMWDQIWMMLKCNYVVWLKNIFRRKPVLEKSFRGSQYVRAIAGIDTSEKSTLRPVLLLPEAPVIISALCRCTDTEPTAAGCEGQLQLYGCESCYSGAETVCHTEVCTFQVIENYYF